MEDSIIIWRCCDLQLPPKSTQVSVFLMRLEGQKLCRSIKQKLWGFFWAGWDISVCLTFNLSKGGKDSRMDAFVSARCSQHSTRGSFSHPPQIVLQRINVSARPRAFCCENEVWWSVVARGWRKRTHNRPTDTTGKYRETERRLHISRWFPILCPSSSEVFVQFTKEVSAVLFAVRWCDLTSERVQPPSSFILRRPAGKFQTVLSENFWFDVVRRSADEEGR